MRSTYRSHHATSPKSWSSGWQIIDMMGWWDSGDALMGVSGRGARNYPYAGDTVLEDIPIDVWEKSYTNAWRQFWNHSVALTITNQYCPSLGPRHGMLWLKFGNISFTLRRVPIVEVFKTETRNRQTDYLELSENSTSLIRQKEMKRQLSHSHRFRM